MSLEDVSCLIPLYESRQYFANVCANIDAHLERGATVYVSDQHMLDDTALLLDQRYRDNPLVVVITDDGGGNWVANVNLLLDAATTPFVRIIPHDDTVEGTATEFLAETLRSRPDAVLSHGHVRAEDNSGNRLPERDDPNFPLRPLSAPDMFSAGLLWQGLFNGAFKSLIRREHGTHGVVEVRPTKDLIHSERAWLFGLSLLGEFVFDERASMRKRYRTGSVSDVWEPNDSHFQSVVDVMASYVDDFIADTNRQKRLRFNLYFNLLRWVNHPANATVARPAFADLMPDDAARATNAGGIP
ncbi:glycosyltransferase family 2 protein [bacterium]|nr:glycosyltransferase family 2 protein [bacterium]MDC0349834.1 glycosyltransferase family 2 protein [bacterium]